VAWARRAPPVSYAAAFTALDPMSMPTRLIRRIVTCGTGARQEGRLPCLLAADAAT
jgi:hypothetical protein